MSTTNFRFIVAGKYGFLTEEILEGNEEQPSRDVRDAFLFQTFEAASAHRLKVTDGKVLLIVQG